jgi:phosphopantetheinyl transferase
MLQLRSYRDYPDAFSANADLSTVLVDDERAHLAGLKAHKRRREWLLGRLAGKEVLRRHVQERHDVALQWTDLSILPSADGAPEITVANKAVPALALSLSHRAGFVVVAADDHSDGWCFGVDIESVEPRIEAFLNDYFTDRERQHLSLDNRLERDRLVTVYWCVKEAVLKAVRKGLSVSADRVEVQQLHADGSVAVRVDRDLSKGSVVARCWHLPQHVVTWAAVDQAGTVLTPPQAPYPAQLWLPCDAMEAGHHPVEVSPKLSLVAS